MKDKRKKNIKKRKKVLTLTDLDVIEHASLIYGAPHSMKMLSRFKRTFE